METKQKKVKRRVIEIAILLMALCVITCFAVGTYAKFVVQNSGYNGARVAKFGVTIATDCSGFSTEYESDDASVAGIITKSVISTDNVVAPGTSGDMLAVTISGTPEVAVAIKYKASLRVTNWEIDDGEFYCPIEIKIGDLTIKGADYDSAAEFENAVEKAIEAYSADYAAGSDLSLEAVKKPAVFWSWAFEGNDDAKDTALGMKAAAQEKIPLIALTVDTTVTQID